MVAAFFSCETKVVEVPVKGGEIARGENKGSKYYLVSDDNVDIVKKLLKAWNNMDPEGMFEVLTDTISWWVPDSKTPILADKEFIMDAYSEAIKKKYKFYSYGDAMMII